MRHLKERPPQLTREENPQYWHPVKRTALLYLDEALQEERYEHCQGFIKIARAFGATEQEVEEALEGYITYQQATAHLSDWPVG